MTSERPSRRRECNHAKFVDEVRKRLENFGDDRAGRKFKNPLGAPEIRPEIPGENFFDVEFAGRREPRLVDLTAACTNSFLRGKTSSTPCLSRYDRLISRQIFEARCSQANLRRKLDRQRSQRQWLGRRSSLAQSPSWPVVRFVAGRRACHLDMPLLWAASLNVLQVPTLGPPSYAGPGECRSSLDENCAAALEPRRSGRAETPHRPSKSSWASRHGIILAAGRRNQFSLAIFAVNIFCRYPDDTPMRKGCAFQPLPRLGH